MKTFEMLDTIAALDKLNKVNGIFVDNICVSITRFTELTKQLKVQDQKLTLTKVILVSKHNIPNSIQPENIVLLTKNWNPVIEVIRRMMEVTDI